MAPVKGLEATSRLASSAALCTAPFVFLYPDRRFAYPELRSAYPYLRLRYRALRLAHLTLRRCTWNFDLLWVIAFLSVINL